MGLLRPRRQGDGVDLLSLLTETRQAVVTAINGNAVVFVWAFVSNAKFDALVQQAPGLYEIGDQGPCLSLAAGESTLILFPDEEGPHAG